MLKTWRNGEKAGVIQKIIENNFKILGRHLSQNVLCLSTAERETLSSEYLTQGLKVYDTTKKRWFSYNGVGWDEENWGEGSSEYTMDIQTSDWSAGAIIIPYTKHLKRNPNVQLFMKNEDVYLAVMGGVEIDADYNITLSTDMPFEGRVVIK